MDIPASGIIGLLKVLFKSLFNSIERLFFRKAYQISTAHHLHREMFWSRPDELYPGIKYRVLWRPYYLGEKLLMPMLWLKADKGYEFSKIALSVSAKNEKICYQDNFHLYGITNIPVKTALPSIPFRNLIFRGNSVLTPYDDIVVKIDELYDAGGDAVDLIGVSPEFFSPFDRLEEALGWEKGDVELWGEVFNFRFIESEIKELEIRLIHRGFNNRVFGYEFRKKLFKRKWLVKIIFWSKNIMYGRQLLSAYNNYIKDFETYKS